MKDDETLLVLLGLAAAALLGYLYWRKLHTVAVAPASPGVIGQASSIFSGANAFTTQVTTASIGLGKQVGGAVSAAFGGVGSIAKTVSSDTLSIVTAPLHYLNPLNW
jgi:hypothetical protein